MSTLNTSNTTGNKPIKCTLTRIEENFNRDEVVAYRLTGILKDYVYSPEKRLIA